MPELHREAAYPAEARPRFLRIDWRAPLLLAYVVVGASLVVSSLGPMTLRLFHLLPAPILSDMAYEGCARFVLGFAIVMLTLGGMLIAGARVPSAVGPVRVSIAAFAAGAAAVAVALLAAGAAGEARVHPGAMAAGAFTVGTLLILLGVTAEELLLRGLLQPVLVRAWGAWAGVSACALAFAAIHVAGGWQHPVSLLNIVLAGIWFGVLALRTGGLVAPILAHFAYNWTEELLFGASPNPGATSFGSAIDVDLFGSAIWGGSVEGLNASIAVSLLLVALIVAFRPPAHASSGKGTSRP